jgi:hypothetical protein
LAGDLQRWLDDRPIDARLPGPVPPGRRRRLSRRAFLWGGLAAAVAVPLGYGVYSWLAGDGDSAEFKRRLEHIQRLIRTRQPADLLDEAGRPLLGRFVVGSGRQLDFNGAWTLVADSSCLFELLPKPQAEKYRLTAEIRHNAGKMSRVGVYVGRSEEKAEDKRVTWFVTLEFADQGAWAGKDEGLAGPRNRASVEIRYWVVGSPVQEHGCPTGATTLFAPPGAGESDWRTLTVDVFKRDVTPHWGSPPARFGDVVHVADEIERWGPDFLRRAPLPANPPTPYFSPDRGLGLFLTEGSISVRNVRIVPIPQ